MAADLVTQKKPRRANGEGSVIERSDGIWMFSQRVGTDEDGKPLRKNLYAPSRAALMRRLADERAKSGGTLRPTVTKTVHKLVEEFLADKDPDQVTDAKKSRTPEKDQRTEIARSTFAGWSLAWRQVKPLVANQRLENFGPKQVKRVRAALRKQYGPRSIQICWQVMRLAFDDAIRTEDYFRPNPWRIYKPPTYQPRKVRALQADEIPAFIAAAEKDTFEAIWFLGLFVGARFGEALGLERAAIDFENGKIHIRQQLTEVNGIPKIERLKTDESNRTVDADPVLMDALRRRLDVADAEGHGSPFVFTTPSGRFPSRTNLRRRNFSRVCKVAGITDFTVHGLRHSWTVEFKESGADSTTIAQVGGWSSTRMVDDRYSRHKREERLREAALAVQSRLTRKAASNT